MNKKEFYFQLISDLENIGNQFNDHNKIQEKQIEIQKEQVEIKKKEQYQLDLILRESITDQQSLQILNKSIKNYEEKKN